MMDGCIHGASTAWFQSFASVTQTRHTHGICEVFGCEDHSTMRDNKGLSLSERVVVCSAVVMVVIVTTSALGRCAGSTVSI